MKEWIKEALIINLLTEQEEGQNLREEETGGPANARQARKQMKETAELLIEITAETK
jgi:hypothetical protein